MTIDTQHTYLITSKVGQRLKEQGRSKRWVMDQIEIGSTAGDLLLRRGVFPMDDVFALKILKKLSEITGFKISEMIETINTDAA